MESEKFHLLPGRVYVKGFLKNYARFLGVDAGFLLAAYEERVPQVDMDEEKSGMNTAVRKRPGGGKMLKAGLGFVAVVLVALFVNMYQSTGKDFNVSPPPLPPVGVENKGVADDRPGEAKIQRPEKQQGVSITLNVTDNESWMRVEVDGKHTFEGLVTAGQVKIFKGNEKIYLRVGNAGVVQVELNGQKIGALGGMGQVVTREFKAPQV